MVDYPCPTSTAFFTERSISSPSSQKQSTSNPSEANCDFTPLLNQVLVKHQGKITWTVVAIVLGVYITLRPSFSSYLAAIPFHFSAVILLSVLSFRAISPRSGGLLANDTFRTMVGACKKDEGKDTDGKCIPLCENKDKMPVRQWVEYDIDKVGYAEDTLQQSEKWYHCIDPPEPEFWAKRSYRIRDFTLPQEVDSSWHKEMQFNGYIYEMPIEYMDLKYTPS